MTDQEQTDAAVTTKPAEPSDDFVTTSHSLGDLHYTVTTGRIVLREEVFDKDTFTGVKSKAELSITAYTREGADAAHRPVTFAFNGGPGSSSAWLHLGVLGPRRIVAPDADVPVAPPYTLTDNHETLLHDSDLVFIDPISTGYSRPSEGNEAKPYLGYRGDIESVAEVIRLWTTRNNRWLSPKFLAGESYGTTRAAGLAAYLQRRFSMYLNGVMLISPVLDFGTLRFTDHNDQPYSLFLPTYAAIAHYHGLHGDRPLSEVLAEAERYAADTLPWVLARGARLSASERADAVATIARLTGLSQEYVDSVDLRIEHVRFYTQLLRHKRLTVGRLDGRFTGHDSDYGRERFSSDPFTDAIAGAYAAGINHYVRAELDYSNDLHYELISDAGSKWSYSDFEGRNFSVADRLAEAMRMNPYLRVHVGCGYYDGGTPHAAAEYTMARLAIPEHLRDNIEFKYYEAGHMMYVHTQSRLEQSRHLSEFVSGGGS